MFSYPVAYVDIETTGGSYHTSRVLEVAVIRIEDGERREFSTLINPEMTVPGSITRLTGIRTNDVTDAPAFSDIADELHDILDGAVFIAHNVRFDYSFLKMEFNRQGIEFNPKLLCTVRMSRVLYKDHKGHSLQKLIERHSIPVLDRHRAMADAEAILYFLELAHAQHGVDSFEHAVQLQLKTQTLPPNLDVSELENIGNIPGVYVFKDEQGSPLYVGKSVSLKNRILSHFRDTHARELKICQNVHHVETIPTGSELAALVLESKLVKELQPLFNRQLRRVSRYALLQKDEADGYATLRVRSGEIAPDIDLDTIYGVYESRTKAKGRIIELTRTFQLCPKLMGFEKTSRACFSYSLGHCKGACVDEEDPRLYNRRFELALEHTKLASWPFDSAVAVPINKEGGQVIIDGWIVRGYISAEGQRVYEEFEQRFDVDEYKILKRFIRENKSLITAYV